MDREVLRQGFLDGFDEFGRGMAVDRHGDAHLIVAERRFHLGAAAILAQQPVDDEADEHVLASFDAAERLIAGAARAEVELVDSKKMRHRPAGNGHHHLRIARDDRAVHLARKLLAASVGDELVIDVLD